MALLELKNITKRYKGDTVLDDVSLHVAEGETLVLFGPSGAGKTVLLRAVCGVIEPDEGKVLIGGEDMTDIEAEDRGVGMAFQNFALFPHMTAFANIASPLEARGQSRNALRAEVEETAKLLKIEHVLTHAPRALSNGQKQRTALARALVGSPPILLLDDPLRNVDAKLRFEMRLELPRLLANRKATVIYVTQDYKEAMALGDRIAVMSAGRIQQLGTPADIYLDPAHIGIARLFGDPTVNLLDVTIEVDGRGAYAEISGTKLRLPASERIEEGRPCVLGLRPETIRFVTSATRGAIPVTIEAETPLNEKTVTLTTTEKGREVLVSRPAGMPGPREGRAHIAVDQQSVLLFDQANGNRMGTRREATAREGAAA